MSRQIAAAVEKTLLIPANVIRGLPVKSAAAELAAKPTHPFGKLGFRGIWLPEYTKPFNPRMMPYAYTWAASFRVFPWRHVWEYDPIFRAFFYSFVVMCFFARWMDNHVMQTPETREVLTAMVVDDLKEQRRALYQHAQKHEDHAYYRHKGCHDGHPLGHGVTDPHVF